MEIKLRKDNVVKSVDSEEKAKALMAKGFVRMDGKGVQSVSKENVERLEKELTGAKKKLQEAEEKAAKAEKELDAALKQVKASEKETENLKHELEGTKEQLEAALKKNKSAEK